MKFEHKSSFWNIKTPSTLFILSERCGSTSQQKFIRSNNIPFSEERIDISNEDKFEKKPICVIRNPIERWKSGVGHKIENVFIHGDKPPSQMEFSRFFFTHAAKFYNWSFDLIFLRTLLTYDFYFIDIEDLNLLIGDEKINSQKKILEEFEQLCDIHNYKATNKLINFIKDLYSFNEFDEIILFQQFMRKHKDFFNENLWDLFEYEYSSFKVFQKQLKDKSKIEQYKKELYENIRN